MNAASAFSETSSQTIKLGKSGAINDVETAFGECLRIEDAGRELLIDMSECTYLDVATLIFLIGVMRGRQKRSFRTRFQLPKSKPVRDFLRVWNFPGGIRNATGVSFAGAVAHDDLEYFGENQKHVGDADSSDFTYPHVRFHDRGLQKLISDKFFSIVSFPIETVQSSSQVTRLVLEESDRWGSGFVRSVLRNHLEGPEGYVASRIVFESMMNALRHANATIIQTTSRFRPAGENDPTSQGQFTLVYWDDGDSIIETLKSAIASGKRIQSQQFPELYSDYQLVVDSADATSTFTINSSLVPNIDTADPLLLLASTFPGISRDVDATPNVHPERQKDAPAYVVPGMGLHVLVNAVVDVFEGSIAFRTRNYFMNIKKPRAHETGAKYRVRVKQAVDCGFVGNMLTIRLPLKKR